MNKRVSCEHVPSEMVSV